MYYSVFRACWRWSNGLSNWHFVYNCSRHYWSMQLCNGWNNRMRRTGLMVSRSQPSRYTNHFPEHHSPPHISSWKQRLSLIPFFGQVFLLSSSILTFLSSCVCLLLLSCTFQTTWDVLTLSDCTLYAVKTIFFYFLCWQNLWLVYGNHIWFCVCLINHLCFILFHQDRANLMDIFDIHFLTS